MLPTNSYCIVYWTWKFLWCASSKKLSRICILVSSFSAVWNAPQNEGNGSSSIRPDQLSMFEQRIPANSDNQRWTKFSRSIESREDGIVQPRSHRILWQLYLWMPEVRTSCPRDGWWVEGRGHSIEEDCWTVTDTKAWWSCLFWIIITHWLVVLTLLPLWALPSLWLNRFKNVLPHMTNLFSFFLLFFFLSLLSSTCYATCSFGHLGSIPCQHGTFTSIVHYYMASKMGLSLTFTFIPIIVQIASSARLGWLTPFQ